MTATKYSYSVSVDTAAAKVGDSIEVEVRTSPIVTAFDFYSVSGDVLDVWFKDALSAGDVVLLAAIVAAHAGDDVHTGVRDDGVLRVQLTPQTRVGSVLVIAGLRFKPALSPDGNPFSSMGHLSFAEDRAIQGATAEVEGFSATNDDKIDFLITHPDGTVLGQFGENLPVPPSGRMPDVVSEGTTDVPAGLRVSLRYTTTKSAGQQPTVYAFLRTHK